MKDILNKIESSFKLSLSGKESVSVLIRWWGIGGYLVSYFIVNKIIEVNKFRFIVVVFAILMCAYFVWHIYALRKCSPKKPELSKEEKAKLKEEARRNFARRFFRKLFLQESISEWNPVFITMMIDVFCIAHFLSYIVR